MRPVQIPQLPGQHQARIRAATGDPGHLMIHQVASDDQYIVEAITGDRVTVMRLSSRVDGSVSEATDSFLLAQVSAVRIDEGGGELDVGLPEERRTIPVSPDTAGAVQAALVADRL